MRFISTRMHGVLDYITAFAIITLPLLFMGNSIARWVLIAAGIVALGYSLLTRYELGVIKTIPMPAHLAINVGFGLVLIASP